MTKMALTAVLAALFLIPAATFGQGHPTKSDMRQKMRELLEKRKPPTEKEVRAVSPDVDSLLADVVNDRTADFVTRKRAVEAMGFFQTKRARQLLRTVITDPAWQKPYRIVAIKAIARSVGVAALVMVKKHASDPDPEVRLACVYALDVMGSTAALTLLRNWQLREKDSGVLRAIDGAIRNLSRDPWEDL